MTVDRVHTSSEHTVIGKVG